MLLSFSPFFQAKVPTGDVGINAPSPAAWLLILLGLLILWRLEARTQR